MIRVDIDETRLGQLFPAYLMVDPANSILSAGPALLRHMPELNSPANLAEHFRIEADDATEQLADLASNGRLVQLVSRRSGMRLSGSVLALERGYIFAMRYVPSHFALGAENLQISDFGPDDPVVPALLMVGMQKALLEESRTIASELAQERQRSMELSGRISRTAGFMAHDFNNFLSIIQLNADRIGREGARLSAGRTRRLAKMISDTAERATDITRSLMTLSRQRFDSPMPLEVDGLIRDNTAFLRSLVGARISLELTLDAEGVEVEASQVALLNSVMNLLINARDAMPDGGCVRLSTGVRQARLAPPGRAADPEPRDYLAIVITDSGTGMAPEVLDRAFETLFSTKAQGNGIGLASVLDFSRDMGGEACIDSRPGEGRGPHFSSTSR
jgi:signal transduction histidine kinase